jgi:hypothetical protein
MLTERQSGYTAFGGRALLALGAPFDSALPVILAQTAGQRCSGTFATCSFGLWSIIINYVTIPKSFGYVFSKRFFSILALIGILEMAIGIFLLQNKAAILTMPASQLTRQNNKTFDLIRQIVPKNETVQSLPFRPSFYIYADRLPASGDIFYLPIQAKYEQNPILERSQICST